VLNPSLGIQCVGSLKDRLCNPSNHLLEAAIFCSLDEDALFIILFVVVGFTHKHTHT
jgi:hypothetical protein